MDIVVDKSNFFLLPHSLPSSLGWPGKILELGVGGVMEGDGLGRNGSISYQGLLLIRQHGVMQQGPFWKKCPYRTSMTGTRWKGPHPLLMKMEGMLLNLFSALFMNSLLLCPDLTERQPAEGFWALTPVVPIHTSVPRPGWGGLPLASQGTVPAWRKTCAQAVVRMCELSTF